MKRMGKLYQGVRSLDPDMESGSAVKVRTGRNEHLGGGEPEIHGVGNGAHGGDPRIKGSMESPEPAEHCKNTMGHGY